MREMHGGAALTLPPRHNLFTSPRLRGEVDRAKRGRVRETLSSSLPLRLPLTPTLTPQAGRGSAGIAGRGEKKEGASHA